MIAKTRKQMSLLITRVIEKLEYNKALLVASYAKYMYFVMFTTLATMCLVLSARVMNLTDELNTVKEQNKWLHQENAEINEAYSLMYHSYSDLAEVAGELDSENQEVLSTYKEQSEELQKFQEREELYDKYEYALFRDEDNTRTDINYDDIKSLETLAEEREMGEDAIDLILNIVKIESDGYADAQNSKSSAAGLAGIIKSTAKNMYDNELGSPNGPYQHIPMAYDSELNLKMGLCLIDVLAEDNNRNVSKTILGYRGTDDTAYTRKLSELIKNNTGKNLYELDI